MSFWNPPRLVELAGKSLLRDEALAAASLEHLPPQLFPPLFLEAFHGRHGKALKAMVHTWPFTRLPLGGLMQTPQQETLRAAFDGLDILLAQKVRPRRWKLQVLDLRHTGQNFWSLWSWAEGPVCSLRPPVAEDSSGTRHPRAPLEVFIDLSFSYRTRDRFLPYLIWWAKQRAGSVHLCCKALKIFGEPIETIQKVLAVVRPGCIQEVEINGTLSLSVLAEFAPSLGQMSNMRTLVLSHIHVWASEAEEQGLHVSQLASQFLRLHHLRKLYMESPSFLQGRLGQVLRCLQTPLETLSITNCLLTESDLKHLSQCPNLHQLKGLDLSGVCLADVSPEPLCALLERVTATLQDLDLVHCGIVDAHAEALLPALSRCCQLTAFCISGNLLSKAVMEKLLRHTAGLSRLSLELYPAPLECYSPEGALQVERLTQVHDELVEILRGLGQRRTIWLSTSPCPCCGHKIYYDVEPILCACDNPV